ncbi:MAG: FecR family protein [Mariprofundaceae bacterium]
MKKLHFAVLVAAITFALPCSAEPALTAVGHVQYVTGSTYVIRNAETIALKLNDAVYSSDEILTADSGRLKLSMNDGSRILIARNSQVSIDHYVTKYGYRISGLFNTLKGKIRFIIAKVKGLDAHFSVQTKSAIIGVKGTDFTVIEPMGTAPTQVMLHSGKIVADSKRGDSHVMKPGTIARIISNGEIIVRGITPQDLSDLGVPVDIFGGKSGVAGVRGHSTSMSDGVEAGSKVNRSSQAKAVSPKPASPKVASPKITPPKVKPPKVKPPKVKPPKVKPPKVKPPKVKPPKVKPPRP